MQIEREIWEWLNWIGYDESILDESEEETDYFLLSYPFTDELIKGTGFKEMLLRLSERCFIDEDLIAGINMIEEPQDEVVRENNYDIILDVMVELGFEARPDDKKLMIKEDLGVFKDLLGELSSYYGPPNGVDGPGNNLLSDRTKGIGGVSLSKIEPQEEREGPGTPQEFSAGDIHRLDLLKLNVDTDLKQSVSIPEILTITLSRAFKITPIEAASLFTQNSKYLALMLAKGFRGEFEPIIDWIREISDIKEHLISLAITVNDESKTLLHFLSLFKAGLVSRNSEVSRYVCRLYSNISFILLDNGRMKRTFDWFISKEGLINMLVLGIKRHVDIVEEMVSLLLNFTRPMLVPLFDEILPNCLQNDMEYFRFLNIIFESLMAREQVREEIEDSGLFNRWCSLCITFVNSPELHPFIKTDYLNFLALAWKRFPNLFQANSEICDHFINFLCNFAGDKSISISSICISILFDLLSTFSNFKLRYAPFIYKRLNQLFIKNYKNTSTRDFFIKNYMLLYVSTDIPPEILLEGYIVFMKDHENQDIELNITDIEFLKFLVSKKNLHEKFIVMFFDLFCKLFMDTIIFASGVMDNITDLGSILLQNPEMVFLVQRFCEILLDFYEATYKKRKIVTGHADLFQDIQVQKRALCIRLVVNMMNLNHNMLNMQIRDKAIKNYINLEDFYEEATKKVQANKGDFYGLRVIIAMFGEVESLVIKHRIARMRKSGIQDQVLLKQSMKKGLKPLINESMGHSFGGMGLDQSENNLVESKIVDLKGFLRPDSGIAMKKNSVVIRSLPSIKMRREKRVPTKQELYDRLIKKGVKDDENGIRKLQEFKKKKEKFDEMMTMEEKRERQKFQKMDKFLKKHLEKRRIQLGVPSIVDLDREQTLDILAFPLDEYEKDIAKFEDTSGKDTIEIVNLTLLEAKEQNSAKSSFHKYRKLWRFIFLQYSNSIRAFDKGMMFENTKEKLGKISRQEFWKFMKEYTLQDLMTKEEVSSLFRLVNVKMLGERGDLHHFFYKGFKVFLLQAIIFMYSRGPDCQAHLPICFSIEKFVQRIIEIFEQRGQKTDFFLNPDKFVVFGDGEVITYLNEQLEEDPEFKIPPTYKKKDEFTYEYEFTQPALASISEPYADCYSILRDILKDALE